MKHGWTAALLLAAATAAWSQAAREPASPALQEHFRRAIVDWDRGTATGPAASSTANSAFANMDFLMKTRGQLRDMGTALFPIAPSVAERMLQSEKNQYTLAFILMDMTPAPAGEQVPGLARKAAGAAGAEQIVALAQLARSEDPAALEALRTAARSPAAQVRLMAVVGLGYAGRAFPELAAQSAAPALKDPERYVRSAGANALRMIGARAEVVAPELIEYLRTKDNVYQAVGALKAFPTAVLRPAKADLEAVVADPKLNSIQKQDAVDILVRMQTQH